MSQPREVFEMITQLALQCGLEGEFDDVSRQFLICFGVPGGRTQDVYVGHSPSEPELRVISVNSPCLVVEKGLFKGVSKNMAVELLKLNEGLNFARYGIQENEESYVIVASYDFLLDTLDPVGFKAALECVALAADSYESKFGQDVF